MTGAEGQASRRWGPRLGVWLHRLGNLAFALVLLAALGLGGLAWRLAEAPLEIPFLARQIEASFNAREDGMRLEIGRAAIAWEGFRGGTAAPLDIRLADVRLHGAAGAPRILLPDAAATFSFRALLRGTLAPATIELQQPRVLALLAPDGSIGLSPGGAEPVGEATGPDPLALLDVLMGPASDRNGLAALRRLRVNGGEFTLLEPATGRRWTLAEPRIDIRRAETGGLVGEGEALFRTGGLAVQVRLHGSAEGAPMRLTAGMRLPALRPAELAAAWPPLAPLSVLDAAVAVTVLADFDAAVWPERVRAQLTTTEGALDLGGGQRLPFAGLDVAAELTGRALTLREARLVLPGAGAARGPALAASGEAVHRDDRWQVALDLRAEPVEARDLPFLWPEGVAPEARGAVLAALPAGRLRDARLRARFGLPEALDGIALEQAQLGLGLDRAVVDLGAGKRIAAEAVELALNATPEALRLERAVLRLPPPATPAAPTPTLRAEGAADRAGGVWRGWLGLRLDAIGFADLGGYWPHGLLAGTRDWMVQNITTGEVRNGQWRIEAEAPEAAPAALRVTALSGSAEATEASVHWLRPIPPATGVSGTAEFSLKEILLRVRGGRQSATEAGRAALDLREGSVRFFNLDTNRENAEINVQLAGPLTEAVNVIRHPRLKLFERRPLKLQVAEGQAEARLAIAFPLLADLPMEELRIRANARVAEARLVGMLLDQDLERAGFELAVDVDSLKASGQAQLLGAPMRLGVEMDFRRGPASQVIERATATGRLDARQLATLGFDATNVLEGPVALEARTEKRRNGQGQVALRGDLRDARLAVEALGWAKPVGTPGLADATLRLQGEALTAIDNFRVEALELSLRGRAAFGRQSRLERLEITESLFGGSRFTGEVRPPDRAGGTWTIGMRGPLLDLRPILGPPGHAEGGGQRDPSPPAAADSPGPPLLLDLRFDRVTMGESRNLLNVQARARTDARGVLREARATGRTAAPGLGTPLPRPAGTPPAPGAPGPFEFTLTPRGEQRQLRLVAEDGGGLLRALDLVNAIRGGRLTVNATYADLRPGAPLSGTAELDQFLLRDAPAAAKLLQAMTVYGLVEAAQGGSGLVFSRAVVPFTLTPDALTLTDARAFSASLGLTAKGRILRERPVAEIEGTIVPAYLLNTLLGNLPIVGRLFSPEAGGGVFAATYRIQGALADPQVTVNPLAALTPGFLRGLFGLFSQGREDAAQGGGVRQGGATPEPAWDGRGPPPR